MEMDDKGEAMALGENVECKFIVGANSYEAVSAFVVVMRLSIQQM